MDPFQKKSMEALGITWDSFLKNPWIHAWILKQFWYVRDVSWHMQGIYIPEPVWGPVPVFASLPQGLRPHRARETLRVEKDDRPRWK